MVYEHDETPDPYEPDMLATPSGQAQPECVRFLSQTVEAQLDEQGCLAVVDRQVPTSGVYLTIEDVRALLSYAEELDRAGMLYRGEGGAK